MPLPADTDVSTPKYLRDKYAIVGVGETTYTRGSAGTSGSWKGLVNSCGIVVIYGA